MSLTLLGTKLMQCWSAEHVRYLVPSYVSMIVYVIGIPVSTAQKSKQSRMHHAPRSLCVQCCNVTPYLHIGWDNWSSNLFAPKKFAREPKVHAPASDYEVLCCVPLYVLGYIFANTVCKILSNRVVVLCRVLAMSNSLYRDFEVRGFYLVYTSCGAN